MGTEVPNPNKVFCIMFYRKTVNSKLLEKNEHPCRTPTVVLNKSPTFPFSTAATSVTWLLAN